MTPDPEAFAAITAAAAPSFSRDGQTIFYLCGSGLAQARARNLASGAERTLAVHDENIAILRRSPVDDRLIYGFDRGGDECQQLWLYDPDAPAARALTDNPRAMHDFGGWSPDGTKISYAANDRDVAHFDVYVQDVATGERQCIYRGHNIITVAGFRPDGEALVVLQERSSGNISLLLLDLASGRSATVGAAANWQSVRWAAGGSTLLALTDIGSDFLRLCRIDPVSGDPSVLYEAPGRDVEAWSLSPDGSLLATIENDRGFGVLRVGAPDGERPAVAGLPHGIIGELSWAADSGTLAFSAAGPTEPADLWLWRDGSVHRVHQPVAAGDYVDYQLVEWPSFDGTRIPAWLALPRTPMPAAGHPAIVWVHGGPESQTRANFRPDIQMLLARGFAVLLPNVRGSTGYGRAWAAADDVAKRLDSVADLAHGRHWLAAHPAIDGARIGIMGQSYGGFMVMSAITEYPDLWRAAVNYYGIADFVSLLAGTGAWRRSHRATEYGDPGRDAGLFARISPIHRIDRVQAPVLIAHGVRDPRVPIGESERFVAALEERQKPVTYLSFDYAGHGFIRPDDKRRIYCAVADFFTAHL